MKMASTSLAAYHSVDITEMEQKVLDVIEVAGVNGCISDEVRAVYKDLSYSTVTARFSSLEKKGAIYRAGDTRPGDSGRQQKVMRLAKYALTVPAIKPPAKPKGKKRNPFLAGMMHAAKMIIKEPDLETAKKALKAELIKVAGR